MSPPIIASPFLGDRTGDPPGPATTTGAAFLIYQFPAGPFGGLPEARALRILLLVVGACFWTRGWRALALVLLLHGGFRSRCCS